MRQRRERDQNEKAKQEEKPFAAHGCHLGKVWNGSRNRLSSSSTHFGLMKTLGFQVRHSTKRNSEPEEALAKTAYSFLMNRELWRLAS